MGGAPGFCRLNISAARVKTCSGPTRSRISVPGPAMSTTRRVRVSPGTLVLLRRFAFVHFTKRNETCPCVASELLTCVYELIGCGVECFLVVWGTEIVSLALKDRLGSGRGVNVHLAHCAEGMFSC